MTTPLKAAIKVAYITRNAEQETDDRYSVLTSSQETMSSYSELKMVRAMSKITETTESVKFDFKSIVIGLLSALVAMAGLIWHNITDDIKDLKEDQKGIEKEVRETRIQLVSALGAVEKQIAVTNQKLDDISSSFKKKGQ